MKKKFALLMCAVMLFGAMLACVPASAAAKTEGGPLAITEVCNSPANEKYEFIEVVNTSATEVDLKNYYIYRFAFSNNGANNNQCAGIRQLFGYSGANANLVRLSLAATIESGTAAGETVDTTLAQNEIAVLWFSSANSKDETVSDFKAYWSGRGVNMTGVNVIKLPVYDASGADTMKVNVKAWNGINTTCGVGWLPDEQAGLAISLIHKDFASTDNGTVSADDYSNADDRTTAKTKARQEAADSIAFMMLNTGITHDRSAHFYGFATTSKFNAARDYLLDPENLVISNATDSTAVVKDNTNTPPAGLMVFEGVEEGKDNLQIYQNKKYTSSGQTKGNYNYIVFPTTNIDYLSNPGILYEGQLGLTGEIRVNDAANGVGSLVLNPAVKPTVENLAVINDEEDKKSEDTTAAPETTAAAAPAEEKGCGSAITASALLVIAPALAAGCVVGTKKRRNRK